ncbi:hypothetical protein [Winogradskyella pulchriflava]|uniref:Uncharacterized protein n=1 Tax=Winogradskyella pulchriflava TaxID=1110688 RepID=A0ABV6Q3X3_9FLAO
MSIYTYGQKSTLLQNINFRAKELKHSLNKDGDSLLLESDRTIYSVEIFNQDFEKTVEVGENQTKIPLNGTPLGRLVVQAKLIDKRILMTLLRHEDIEESSEELTKPIPRPNTKIASVIKELTINNSEVEVNFLLEVPTAFEVKYKAIPLRQETQLAYEDLNEDVVETENTSPDVLKTTNEHTKRPSTSLTNMLNWKPKKETFNERFYWIALEINNGNSSYKTMKLVKGDVADKLISKNKLESKTNNGKYNKLTAWEVYDTAKFMEEQIENPEYINSPSSHLFNVVPYYTTIPTKSISSL